MQKETIIAIVGFLGAGKTTLLRKLIDLYLGEKMSPYIVLNDYENAYLDAQQISQKLNSDSIKALNGSCICCTGIGELRDLVNNIPQRKNGITLIEANGTSDACSLMGFLGVGINDRFLPPIQLSVVDANNWQKRDEHNELEANQVQVSSLIVLSHLNKVNEERKKEVIVALKKLNSFATIIEMKEIDVRKFSMLKPSENKAQKMNHHKSHWSSCSVALPSLPNLAAITKVCSGIPQNILRVKGCTKVGTDVHFTYFERTPDGSISVRPYNGIPTTGPMLLAVGAGSEPDMLSKAIRSAI
ncbi:MAG: G3E family GTPase [Glaciecola sp.]|jgi:G3E family GTPase